MAKLIRIDGKLARKGGKLVRDTGGAPCCCGEPPPPMGCFDLNPPERGHMAAVYLLGPTSGTCNRPTCRLPECFEFRLKIRASRFYEYRQCLSNSTPCFQAFEERVSTGSVEVDLTAQCAWSIEDPGPGWGLVEIEDQRIDDPHQVIRCYPGAMLWARIPTFRVRFAATDTPGVPNLYDYDVESTNLDLLKVTGDDSVQRYRFLWRQYLREEADRWSARLYDWATLLGLVQADYQYNWTGDAQFTFVDDQPGCEFFDDEPPNYEIVGGIHQYMKGGWSCCQYNMHELYEEWSNCRDYWGVNGDRQGAECVYPESPLYHWELDMTSRILPGTIGECGDCLEENGCSECVQTTGEGGNVGNRSTGLGPFGRLPEQTPGGGVADPAVARILDLQARGGGCRSCGDGFR